MMNNDIDLELNIYPIKHLGKTKLLIKCYVQDEERIKQILRKALSNKEITSLVEFKNKWKAIPKLIELDLLKKEDITKDQFFKEFLINKKIE